MHGCTDARRQPEGVGLFLAVALGCRRSYALSTIVRAPQSQAAVRSLSAQRATMRWLLNSDDGLTTCKLNHQRFLPCYRRFSADKASLNQQDSADRHCTFLPVRRGNSTIFTARIATPGVQMRGMGIAPPLAEHNDRRCWTRRDSVQAGRVADSTNK